jgi:hypothetical protein
MFSFKTTLLYFLRNGTCAISPTNGTTLQTLFTVICNDFIDEQDYLQYRFELNSTSSTTGKHFQRLHSLQLFEINFMNQILLKSLQKL